MASTSGTSPQRRLPPLKQQLLQQTNHVHHHLNQSAAGSATHTTNNISPSSGQSGLQNNDSNNNKSGRATYHYSKNIKLNNVSPYHISNSGSSIAYLGVTHLGTIPASLSATGQAKSPVPDIKNKKASPRTRPAQFRVPIVRSMSQHGGTDLKITGHSPNQTASAESRSDVTIVQGENLDLESDELEYITDLNPEVVSQYLRQNPEVLDHHVTTYVNSDRVKKWLQLKTVNTYSRSSNSRLQLSVTNGEHTSDKNLTLTRWKNKIQTSKGKLLQELSKDFQHSNGKITVLLELAECVSAALSADAYTLYSCELEKQELTHISKGEHDDVVYGAKERVCLGTSVSASVAFTKEPTRIKDLLGEKRCPDRLKVSNNKAHCVLGLPIMDDGDTCFGVVEFYKQSKNSQFTEEEEEVAIHMLQWYDLLVDYVETHSMMIRQRTLSDFLLEVTKSIFQDIVSMDIVIIKIMNFAQQLVHADRASLFLVDVYKRELYARIFDVGYTSKEFLDKCSIQTKEVSSLPINDPYQQEIRFPKI